MSLLLKKEGKKEENNYRTAARAKHLESKTEATSREKKNRRFSLPHLHWESVLQQEEAMDKYPGKKESETSEMEKERERKKRTGS